MPRTARSATLAVAAVLALMVAPVANADEGMWLLDQLDQLDFEALAARGMDLEPSDLWNPATGEGLAAACVSFGGCSASLISPDGLIATNHHCAFGAIQYNSTPQRNILEDGFVARSRAEELHTPGSHVYVLDSVEDVTATVIAAIPADADDPSRARAEESVSKRLVADCEKEAGVRCRVAGMWGGLRYLMFRQLDLRDVRLVHAPALGIGEFGGDIDNWMWPRHTGDYSLLRAYVGPDGRPADFSPDNVPFRPRRWLKISPQGVGEEGLVFVLGYPGRTMRLRTSDAVRHYRDIYYPENVRLLGLLIAELEKRSATSTEVGLKNASRIKYMNNSMKNNQGMLDGLHGSGLVQRKAREEADLNRWIEADPARSVRFGGVVDEINSLWRGTSATARRDLVAAMLGRASSLLDASAMIVRMAEERPKADLEREEGYQDRDMSRSRVKLERMQRSLDEGGERATLRLILLEASALPADQRIDAVDSLVLDGGGEAAMVAVDRFLDRAFASTALTDPEQRLRLFETATTETLSASDDPFIQLALAMAPARHDAEERDRTIEGAMQRLQPRLAQALSERSGRAVYPDANGTLRLSFGTVRGYSPRDAVTYHWMTSLTGLVAKDTGDRPFDSPTALLEAAASRSRSPYLDAGLHDVPVNFLATLDSTGGNSGSPVMDGSGRLVGLLFDGNYESMASDWVFDPVLTRSIMVDVRYMLWVMDRVYGADELLREMGDPMRVLD